MSLAILPSSPIAYSQLMPPGPSPSKRPRLTLDTQSSSSLFGKASTSLRLETLSATSPTVRNTFQNGYNAAPRLRTPGAKRPTLTPLATSVPSDIPRQPTPLRTELPTSAESADLTSSSAISSTSISTVDSLPAEIPYKLAYNVTSILSNGPILRTRTTRSAFARSRLVFPPAKKVAFRAPLTEDIRTSKYTAAHSDIEPSLSSVSISDLPQPDEDAEKLKSGEPTNEEVKAGAESAVSVSPQTGEKRESSEEEDSDTCPATPVAGRRKKSRAWRWTLGPIDDLAEQQRPDDAGIGEGKTEGI